MASPGEKMGTLNESPSPSRDFEIVPSTLLVDSGDVAFQLLKNNEAAPVTLDKAAFARVLRKTDLLFMPVMAITEMLQFLDKTTLSYAALFGLQADTHLHGTDYSWLGSIFYFGYMISQPLSGILLQRISPAKCLAGSLFLWSVILFMHVVCHDFAGLMVVRFFLGLVEGITFPAFILISAAWYPRETQPFRMGFWFSFNGIAQIVGGILSYGLGHIVSSIESWKWMFLVTGAITTVWSIVVFFILPDNQVTAWFLDDSEKRVAIELVRNNNTGIHNKTFKPDQFKEALLDFKTWLLFFLSFLINVPNSVSSFGNLVIQGFGFSSLTTTLLSMPAGGYEFVYIFSLTFICARFLNARTYVILLSCCISLLGGILVLALPYENKAGLLAGYYIIYSYPLANLLLLSLVAANTAGHTKKLVTNALLMIGYSVGNISGPQFYKSNQAPRYHLGMGSLVLSLALCIIFYTALMVYLKWQNKRREPARLAALSSGTTPENIEFLDLTDQENPVFVYVY